MPLPKDKNLDLIFCIKKERVVHNDNTIQVYGQTIQIPPSKEKRTFAKSTVEVCLLENKKIFVLDEGSVIAKAKLSNNNNVLQKEKKIEELLSNRKYIFTLTKIKSKRNVHEIPPNHPWRAPIFKGSPNFGRIKINISK